VSVQATRDVVVIGASAGGFEVLLELTAALPRDFPGSIFIAQHMSARAESRLAELLDKRSRMPIGSPIHGQAIERGRIYVAPPDTHLTLRYGAMEVTRGARENSHRPSVDALFRSAARSYGPRVIGVVLTGYRDCGTAGLLSIKARGGLAIAQDPRDAAVPDMPRSAIEHANVDHVVTAAELPALLERLAAQPAPSAVGEVDVKILELEGERRGAAAADLTCPACQGVLTETQVGPFHQFRCHVGHTFTLQSVLAEQTEETERALWSAVRALEESASLAQRVAERSHGDLKERFLERQSVLSRDAALVRRILIGRETHPELDEPRRLERSNTPG
jgi:two-component system chemotaxis response regulator CheB